jgi:hypothetical protein
MTTLEREKEREREREREEGILKKVSRLRPVMVEDLMRLKYIDCTLCEHLS